MTPSAAKRLTKADGVGHPFVAPAGEGREFFHRLCGDPPAEHQFACLDQPVERAAPPALRGFAFVRAPVAGQRRFRRVAPPARGMALVDRMQRVDDDEPTRQRHARRDEPLAEAGEHRRLGVAGEAGLGDPGGEGGERAFVHGLYSTALDESRRGTSGWRPCIAHRAKYSSTASSKAAFSAPCIIELVT